MMSIDDSHLFSYKLYMMVVYVIGMDSCTRLILLDFALLNTITKT